MQDSLGDIVRGWAAGQPDELALSDGRRDLTFQDIETEASAFARRLQSLGIRKGDRILLIAEKRWEIVVAAIGIWKAGAIYAPVDVQTPPGRLSWLRSSLEPAAIVAPEARRGELAALFAAEPFIAFERAFERLTDGAADADADGTPPLAAGAGGSDVAYILHTSGSTGTPKGVAMSHGAVLSYFRGHNEAFGFAPGKRCLNNAPFHFDVSIQDTFLPLSFGAAVFLTRGLPIGPVLRRQLERDRITHLICVVTVLAMITGDGAALASADLSAIEVVMTGAETCDPRIINAWFDVRPDVLVINGYGPTEVNSISVVHLIRRPEPERTAFFPIGRPLSTVLALLVDEDGRRIDEADAVGELLLGGPQLMEGYWRNPDATAKAFVTIDGERYYRTGDLCHLDRDGNLVFDGRRDAEVKIAGRRIHLIEIESVLLRHSGASQASVGVVELAGQKTIVAALFFDDGGTLDAAGMTRLRESLARDLPPYMVPPFLGVCDQPMLLGSGKTDVKRVVRLLGDAAIETGASDFLLTGTGFVPHAGPHAAARTEETAPCPKP